MHLPRFLIGYAFIVLTIGPLLALAIADGVHRADKATLDAQEAFRAAPRAISTAAR